ncbi:C40 family peptidase [uncultured Cedecea sp.]|uniref:C40 family peptidase n=1 Tax=uncultured Cedecea sp. TaxID=988762 RepID=UPI0026210343|nr:C40 family peptidase [uncultured Cedecea sp.]
MTRITIRSLTLCTLLFALSWTPVTQASQQTRTTELTQSTAKKNKEKSRQNNSKTPPPKKQHHASTSTNKTRSVNKSKPAAKTTKPSRAANKKNTAKAISASGIKTAVQSGKCVNKKGKKTICAAKPAANLTLSQAHKARVQKAQKTAMTKLMGQLGKPYRWGGTSPRTGFDCSGLVYYAYKDLVNFQIPRTANEMYHLEDAARINRSELERGDLVFFRIQGRGTADHVGVYVGNGKFIQSPRSGRDIQITSLSEDYWQRHYVGARRVMTAKTLR